MDLNSINTNINRLLTNIWNVISFLKEYTVDESKDVSITHVDPDGSEVTKTFPNITKQIEINKLSIHDLMFKLSYVDQANGNDDNNGSTTDTAFRSLQKAFNTIPTGGHGIIYILGVYDLGTSQEYTKFNKNIRIIIGPDSQLRNRVAVDGSYAIQGGIIIQAGTSLTVRISDSDSDSQLTKIYSPANNTGVIYKPTFAGFFGFPSGSPGGFAKLSIITRVRNPDTEIIRIEDGYFFWRRNWDDIRSINPSLSLIGHYTGKYVIGHKLADFDSTPAMFNISANVASFVDLSGNAITDFSTIVDGIVRDSNGIPRNISSNIIF